MMGSEIAILSISGYLHRERRIGCDSIWHWLRWQGPLSQAGG